jgi:hypothetical protein
MQGGAFGDAKGWIRAASVVHSVQFPNLDSTSIKCGIDVSSLTLRWPCPILRHQDGSRVRLPGRSCCAAVVEQSPGQVVLHLHNAPELLGYHTIVQDSEVEGAGHSVTLHSVMPPPPEHSSV